MSEEGGGRTFLGIVGKILGLLLTFLGIIVAYYAYTTQTSMIDPKIVAPLGVALVAIGGFMLLARVK